MSVIALPTGLMIGAFSMGQKRFDLTEVSDSGGSTAARLLGPPRWVAGLSSPQGGIDLAAASLWEALVLQLRGQVNHLALYDLVRVAPRGTCRGTMTLNALAAQGATSIVIAVTGQNGLKLLTGDWLQIGSGTGGQLVKVMADATANAATITVTIEPPIRPAAGFAGGTAVTWDKALGHYKMVSEAPTWTYDAGNLAVSGFAIDLLEQWT